MDWMWGLWERDAWAIFTKMGRQGAGLVGGQFCLTWMGGSPRVESG